MSLPAAAAAAETWELCRELPSLSEPESVLVFREREQEWKAPLIQVREVALPLREPGKDALGLS